MPTGSSALTAGLDPADESDGARARRLLAGLLDWHRREEKSQWWRWFDLSRTCRSTSSSTQRDALAGLEFVEEVRVEKKSVVLRYRFQPQDHPFGPGDEACDTLDGKRTGEIVEVDDVAGTIDLKRAIASDRPHPLALVRSSPIDQEAMKHALLRVVDEALRSGLDAGFAYPAIADLLARRPPRLEPPLAIGEPLRPRATTRSASRRGSGRAFAAGCCRSRARPAPARRTPPRG